MDIQQVERFKEINDQLHKVCLICGETKTRDNFYYGVHSYCKPCCTKLARERRNTPEGKLKAHSQNTRMRQRYNLARYMAKKRSLEWDITLDDYWDIVEHASCCYCGFPINSTGVGLDRKDNNKGYTADNVVACCKECNQAKNATFTYDEMLIIGRVIGEVKMARQLHVYAKA